MWYRGVIPTIVPVPSFSLGSHVAAVSANDLLTYTGSSAPTGTYTWDFGGGLASPGFGVGPHLVSWSTAGLKTISLSVTEDGCSSVVYTDTVLVETTTDLENLSINRDCSVYPNPSNGSFKIMFTNNIKNTVEVKLIDIQGRVVYENRFENVNKSVSIEAQNLPNAVYTATIITEGEVINKKVLINM